MPQTRAPPSPTATVVELLEADVDPDREPLVVEPEPEARDDVADVPLGDDVAVLDPGELVFETLPPAADVADDCEPPELAAGRLECVLETESVNPPVPLSELDEHAASATMAVVDNRRRGDLMKGFLQRDAAAWARSSKWEWNRMP